MSALMNLSYYFELFLPIITFILVVTALTFVLYLRTKTEALIEYTRSIARDIKRIADALDKPNDYR